MNREIMQQALDKKADNARELGLDYEPEQEPFAWVARHKVTGDFIYSNTDCNGAKLPDYFEVLPVYLAPPRKEWAGLTNEEIEELANGVFKHDDFARAIEAKLKEKNCTRQD